MCVSGEQLSSRVPWLLLQKAQVRFLGCTLGYSQALRTAAPGSLMPSFCLGRCTHTNDNKPFLKIGLEWYSCKCI